MKNSVSTSDKRRACICAAASLGLCIGSGRAGDFVWQGECESSNWYAICWNEQGWCDPEHTLNGNNWGALACAPAAPAFPGAADDVFIPFGEAILDADGEVRGLAAGTEGRLMLPGDAQGRRLRLAGDITNNGVISLNENQVGECGILLDADVTLSGVGELLLNYDGAGACIDSTTGHVLTQASSHTIRGRGRINCPLVNYGTIIGDRAEYRLQFRGGEKINHGVIRAIDMGAIDLLGVTLTQSPEGLLRVEGTNAQVYLNGGATIAGGRLNTTVEGGAVFNFSGLNTLRDVVIEEGSWVGIHGHSEALAIAGASLLNDGQIVVNWNMGIKGELRFVDDVVVEGTGDIWLKMEGVRAQLNTAAGAAATNAAGHTIHGRGQVNAALINEGRVVADWPGCVLFLRLGNKTNEAEIGAVDGGRLHIQDVALTQTEGGELSADGGEIALRGEATVTGGVLGSVNGGIIRVSKGVNTLGNVAIVSGTEIEIQGVGGAATVVLAGSCICNDGRLNVIHDADGEGALACSESLSLSGAGEIVLDGALLSTEEGAILTQGESHMIRGWGALDAAMVNYGTVAADASCRVLFIGSTEAGFVNAGTVEIAAGSGLMIENPARFSQTGGETIVNGVLDACCAELVLTGGGLSGSGGVCGSVLNSGGRVAPGAGIGRLYVSGSYSQASDASLHIVLGGPADGGENDVLEIAHAAMLAGELRVDPVGGYYPTVGRRFTILTADSIAGEFERISGPGMYDVSYNEDCVTIEVRLTPIPGDLDHDGDVDLSDLAGLLGYFGMEEGAGYDQGDIDADGDVGLGDLAALLGVFGMGV